LAAIVHSDGQDARPTIQFIVMLQVTATQMRFLLDKLLVSS
jgi:hypothetical protein